MAKVTYINSFMYEMGGTILASNLFSKINGININARAIKNNTNENKYINSIDSTYGISSYIYYIYMLYKINNDDKLLEDFNEMLNILLSYDYEKLPKDLFGGLSGSLLILNKIYQDLDSKSNYKKLLLKVITKQIKVFNNIDFSKLSAGYAHGLSGIIYTLNSIYKNFETKETSNKILNLISLEDSYFNNKIGNYLDARSNVYDHYYLCYGLPGILQVRLRLESTFKNKEFIKKSLLK
ncbi:TPA: hypothetical protein O1U99_002764, partial [Staphylococcus aureus]|nr:hypothetical protein [Staphylococcus aureus]